MDVWNENPINGGHELLAWQWSDSSSVNTVGFSGEGGMGGGGGALVQQWSFRQAVLALGGSVSRSGGIQCERVIMFLC